MQKALTIRFYGRVFGVGFRRYVYRHALDTHILGFVENDYEDESVHIEAEGEENDMDKFIALCSKGTPFSMVTETKIIPKELTGEYKVFLQIR